MPRPLKLLLVEDNPMDAELVLRELRRADFAVDWARVDNEAAYLERLQPDLDLVISDFAMPQFNGLRALELLKQRGLEVPFILVSGTIGEETGVEAMKLGADDFLLKDRLARLGNSVSQSLEESRLRGERKREDEAQQRQQAEMRVLFDLMPAMIWFKDAKDRILRVNQQAADAAGKSVAEIEGKPSVDVYPLEAAKFYADDLEVIHSGVSKLGIVETLRGPEGRELWVQTDKVPVFEKDGKVVGIVVMARDVTARRQTEENLLRNQTLLRMAARLSRMGAWSVELPALMQTWSDEVCAIYEVPPGFSTSVEAAINYYVPEYRGTVTQTFEACVRDGTPFDIEAQLLTAKGRRVWVRSIGEAERDGAGVIRRVQGAIQDITERKQIEDSLRLLNVAVLQTTESILITDAHLNPPGPRIVFVNPAFTLMTGYPAEEVLGRSPGILQGPLTDRAVLDRLRQNLEHGEVFQGEAINYRKDGTTFPLEWQVAPIRDERGTITNFVAIQHDITVRRKELVVLRASEEQFRQVVENIREVFLIRDMTKNTIVYVSPAYEEVWGRSCESLYAEEHLWNDSVHPEDRARIEHARRTKYSNGDYDETFRITRPDGGMRWIHSRAFPIREKTGEVRRMVGICEDITDYHIMEEQFRQAQKMEAIGTLAGGIAHDFNNILAAIVGYTELSRMILKDNPAVREHLGAVLQATNRATDLVRQILTFSRQQKLSRRPIQLRPVVEETLKLLRATIPATIEFDLALATDAPTVLADATQIHQILMNLGTNAWHAMKDRPGRLHVKLERCVVNAALAGTHPRLHPGLYARVSVGDTGSGMDPATLRRIFEPFFTTKPPGEGTGLGLAVVHGIMDSHDGAVTVSSRPGEGTVFSLYFPAHAGEALMAVTAEGALPRGQGERLLFVDDEDLLVQLGQKTLTALGYEVEGTTQPEAALAMVRADPGRFALVLTDQTMPGMTGLLLAGQLRQIRPGLPIILMTGYSALLTAETFEAAGIHQLLLKPTSLQSLGTAVHAALSGQPAR